MSTRMQDLRYALRMLKKNPTFSIVAVLTLALGIGGNAAMFSVLNAVLLRPLPYRDPSRLVLIHEGVPSLGFPKVSFSAPDLMLYEQQQHSFEGMAAYRDRSVELSGTGEPERITTARVSANLSSLLGIEPVLGRFFRADEDRPGSGVAVLSYGLWQSRFGGARDVLGRTINLDRMPHTIIGVMPRDFRFPLPGPPTNSDPAQAWVPIAFTPDELQGWGNMFNNDVIARLRPGVSLTQARAEAGLLAPGILRAYPKELLKQFGVVTLNAEVDPLQTEITGQVKPVVLVLQSAVGLVLLITCTNVALLLLVRASGRSREIAIRAAMGASRSRLLAQLLTESFVLAGAGGVLSLALTIWCTRALLRWVPDGIALPRQLPLDAPVLAFTLLATLFTALVFGLAPALYATRTGVRSGLQEGGRSGTAGRNRHRLQGAFVVVEFALALLLMVGAGLLLRSFSKLLAATPGFQPEKVLAMFVPLPAQAYPHAFDVRGYYQRAITEVSQIPGVISAAAANDLPLNGDELEAIGVEGRDPSAITSAVFQTWVLGDYLQTMGVPLLRGRLFTQEDRQGTLPVIVISQNMARQLWPTEDPIGKRIRRGDPGAPWRTVVGVVGDVHDGALSADPVPHMYSPYLQESDAFTEDSLAGSLRRLNLAVRTYGDPASVTASVLAKLHSLDPALAVSDVRTMQAEIDASRAPQRFNAALVGVYAAVALLLALVGIYGVLAYMVLQQTHEIGIRMALGAQRGDVLRLVMRYGMRLVAAGSVVGLAGAWGVTRLMQSLLYGVAPRDPMTFFGVAAFLTAAAFLACYLPATRAARVDPMVALRYE